MVGSYERLVERVDRGRVEAMLEESRGLFQPTAVPAPPILALDPLVDSDLRPMRLAEISMIEGSERLVELGLQSGGQNRQVVAGLGGGTAAELVGECLLAVENLEPRLIRGRKSQGMILAAQTEGGAAPVTFDCREGELLE